MAGAVKSVEVSDVPELLRIAEEVQASGEPRVLRRRGEDLAVLSPLPSASRPRPPDRREADFEAFMSAAGSWSDEDVDDLVGRVYEQRRRASRPPVAL